MPDVPALQQEPTPIKHVVPKLRLAIYGDGGVGKTTLALSFPKPIVVDTDGGLEGDAVLSPVGDQWSPEKWQDLNALYFWLKDKVQKGGYETIIIDSGDTLASFILGEAMAQPTRGRKANAHLTELVQPEQPDYGKVAKAMEAFLTNLRRLDVNIIITSSVREPDPERGRTKRQFNAQPAVENFIEHWANVYGELVVVERNGKEHRVLHTRSSDPERKCKTRFAALHPGVVDPTYTLLVTKIQAAINNAPKGETK